MRSQTPSTYDAKRRFDETPEPPGPAEEATPGDVDPASAPAGDFFVIHQHHATRLHFDLRLEMYNGRTPVLVSWAVPKNLPLRKGERVLAIHVEDHPFDYGTFSGTIPKGNYGAGEVRIFDTGTYELLEQKEGKLTFRLRGRRLQGVWHMVRTGVKSGKEQWLAFLREDERPPADPPPPADPMLATLADDGPFDDPAWSFEPKWDGIRAIAVCTDATVLVSRNRNEITAAYPELHRLHERLVAIDGMVDGEIVALESGVPSFEKLQSRMHVRDEREVARLAAAIPVTFVAFDLVYLDGRSLIDLPLEERRAKLEAAIVPSANVQVSPAVPRDGTTLYQAAKAQRLEGIVAKRLGSRYEPGRRSRAWLKIKTTIDADLVIAGWIEGQKGRAGRLGSLVLAVYDGPRLHYAGNCGTGFTDRSLAEVGARLAELGEAPCPFPRDVVRDKAELRHAHWVPPLLVATVEFRQLTGAGRLRAASFKGLRDDKRPEECTLQDLQAAAAGVTPG
jgi:bifunctional non-homologous end joining protein LigD